MTEILICRFCRYSTQSSSAMKAHFKTLKHKQNRKIERDAPSEEEAKLIIVENESRRSETSSNKNFNGLINIPQK